MATNIYLIPHILPTMWHILLAHTLVKWYEFIFSSLESEWNFVTTQPVQYNRSEPMSLPRVDHKTSMHYCLFSWDTHTWNIATKLWQSPRNFMDMTHVGILMNRWWPSKYPMLTVRHVSEVSLQMITAPVVESPQPSNHSTWCCMEQRWVLPELQIHKQNKLFLF